MEADCSGERAQICRRVEFSLFFRLFVDCLASGRLLSRPSNPLAVPGSCAVLVKRRGGLGEAHHRTVPPPRGPDFGSNHWTQKSAQSRISRPRRSNRVYPRGISRRETNRPRTSPTRSLRLRSPRRCRGRAFLSGSPPRAVWDLGLGLPGLGAHC